MKNRAKNIIIGFLSISLLTCVTIICILVFNSSYTKELTGEVIISDSKYLIIETKNGDYLLDDSKSTYEVGDKIKISYKEKNINKENNPPSIKLDSDKLIEKKSDEKTDEKNDKDSSTSVNPQAKSPTINSIQAPTTSQSPTHESPTNPTNNETADETVTNYVENLKKDFDSAKIKDSLKDGFITVIDFLFYDGKIKNHTFKELSDSAKLKVLSIALYFDNKIDTYFPGYKENISKTTGKIYTNIKESVVETYLMLTTDICENNKELCISAKKSFSEIKKNFSISWSLIKDIAGDGISKLKDYYEIFRAK